MVLISWILPDDPGGITCMVKLCCLLFSNERLLGSFIEQDVGGCLHVTLRSDGCYGSFQ